MTNPFLRHPNLQDQGTLRCVMHKKRSFSQSAAGSRLRWSVSYTAAAPPLPRTCLGSRPIPSVRSVLVYRHWCWMPVYSQCGEISDARQPKDTNRCIVKHHWSLCITIGMVYLWSRNCYVVLCTGLHDLHKASPHIFGGPSPHPLAVGFMRRPYDTPSGQPRCQRLVQLRSIVGPCGNLVPSSYQIELT